MPETTLTAAIAGFLLALAAILPPVGVWIKTRSDRDKFVLEEASKYEGLLERIHQVETAAIAREGEYTKELASMNIKLDSANAQLEAANKQLDAANARIVQLNDQVTQLNSQIAMLIGQKTIPKEG